MATRSAAQNLAKTAISWCTAARGSASAKAPGRSLIWPAPARSSQSASSNPVFERNW